MQSRCLELVLPILCLLSISNPAFSLEKKRECAPTLDSYVADRYGADYKEDQNIRIEAIPGTPFSWVIDNTPSVNPDRNLLETTVNGSCLVLHAPLANSIYFKLGHNRKLPQNAWTETSVTNDFEKTRISYVKKNHVNSYRVLKCEKIRQGGEAVRFDCADIFPQ